VGKTIEKIRFFRMDATRGNVDGRLGNPSETFTGGNERPRFVAMDRADGLSRVAKEDASDGAALGMEGSGQMRE
jgi:hypothetical protein